MRNCHTPICKIEIRDSNVIKCENPKTERSIEQQISKTTPRTIKMKQNKTKFSNNEVNQRNSSKQEVLKDVANKNLESRHSVFLNRPQILEKTKFHSNNIMHQPKTSSVYKTFIKSHCMKSNNCRNTSLKQNSDKRKICNKSTSYFKEDKSMNLSQSKMFDFTEASFTHYHTNSKDNDEVLSERKRKNFNQSN